MTTRIEDTDINVQATCKPVNSPSRTIRHKGEAVFHPNSSRTPLERNALRTVALKNIKIADSQTHLWPKVHQCCKHSLAGE